MNIWNLIITLILGPHTLNINGFAYAGTFWQITDIHWDLDFSEFGDETKMCHASSNTANNTSIGRFGSYMCDSPYALVDSALQTMKNIKSNPSFILWTGDNAPHTDNSVFPVIFKTILNITQEINLLFGPNVPLIPVLGNHDTFPKDDYPVTGEAFYSRYLEEGGWKNVIPSGSLNDFRKGGYFKANLNLDVDVLVLNTNLYYRSNELGEALLDPAGQFAWLRKQLQSALDFKTKVFVAAHSPPGAWERKPGATFLNDTYNDEYIDILNDYGEAIIAQIYGHEHTDSFRIFGKAHDDLKSVGFIAPSVTPWLPNRLVGGTAINPSLRLYNFSSSSVLDYIQYHLNLTEANNANCTEEICDSSSCVNSFVEGVKENVRACEVVSSKAPWKEYYRATRVFGVDILDVDGLAAVYAKLYSNDSFFQDYYLRNSAGIDHDYCDETCKKNHLCAIAHSKASSLSACLTDVASPASSNGQQQQQQLTDREIDNFLPVPSHFAQPVALAVIAIIVSLLIIGVMMMIVSARRNKLILNSSTGRLADFKWLNGQSGYKPLSSVEGN